MYSIYLFYIDKTVIVGVGRSRHKVVKGRIKYDAQYGATEVTNVNNELPDESEV